MPTEQIQNDGKRQRVNIIRVILVVGVIVFCADLLISPKMSSIGSGDARPRATLAQISAFSQALDLFKVDNGYYPTGTNALQALITAPAGATNWHQYLDSIPIDQWGHAYVYECPGKHRTNSYDLFSMGPDGRAGTEDDIVNW